MNIHEENIAWETIFKGISFGLVVVVIVVTAVVTIVRIRETLKDANATQTVTVETEHQEVQTVTEYKESNAYKAEKAAFEDYADTTYTMPADWEPSDEQFSSYTQSVKWMLGLGSYDEMLPLQYGLHKQFSNLSTVECPTSQYTEIVVNGDTMYVLELIDGDGNHWYTWHNLDEVYFRYITE